LFRDRLPRAAHHAVMRTQIRQRGLGALGTIIVLILFVGGGYYAYKYAMEPDTVSAPSCKARLNSCLASCRKTTSEAPQAQACQEDCNNKAASCVEPKR
jgi:hypothetical protein